MKGQATPVAAWPNRAIQYWTWMGMYTDNPGNVPTQHRNPPRPVRIDPILIPNLSPLDSTRYVARRQVGIPAA